VLTRWQGGFAAVVVTLATCGLVAGDLTDEGFRRWWVNHALTTDTVAGLLVLLVTVLIVDQVVSRRSVRDRSRAIAAQAAILMAQAVRSSRAVSSALAGSADRGDAADEVRTYMMMLLVGAPILIDAEIARNFLEEAQRLAGEMAHMLTTMRKASGPLDTSAARLSDAVSRLQAALAPLLQVLTPDERELVDTGDGDSP
jgi:hypothetical protein